MARLPFIIVSFLIELIVIPLQGLKKLWESRGNLVKELTRSLLALLPPINSIRFVLVTLALVQLILSFMPGLSYEFKAFKDTLYTETGLSFLVEVCALFVLTTQFGSFKFAEYSSIWNAGSWLFQAVAFVAMLLMTILPAHFLTDFKNPAECSPTAIFYAQGIVVLLATGCMAWSSLQGTTE